MICSEIWIKMRVAVIFEAFSFPNAEVTQNLTTETDHMHFSYCTKNKSPNSSLFRPKSDLSCKAQLIKSVSVKALSFIWQGVDLEV